MQKIEIKRILQRDISGYEKIIKKQKEILRTLASIEMRKITYIINLEELMHDEDLHMSNPTRTLTEYTGSLTKAIAKAEEDFANERDCPLDSLKEIPIKYTVEIKIGKHYIHIREENLDRLLNPKKKVVKGIDLINIKY